MHRPIILAALLVTARFADAQEGPDAKEMVYILADSLDWVLTYHTVPESRTIACEVATRTQPGAIFRRFFQGQRTLTVYLMASTAQIDSFVLQVDEKRPVVRKPTYEERRNNVLHLRGSQLGGHIDALVGAARLRVQVLYPGREKQDLEIDLAGFTPLYWRAMQLDCIPPQVLEEHCQYLQKKYPGRVSRSKSGQCGLGRVPKRGGGPSLP
ncbi:MAG TPA: hypothetical protein VFD64_14165 [Gemmatimonadaceae bacterium]|nr:hypothetical protein [Gemmatimonadaceae bacterium]